LLLLLLLLLLRLLLAAAAATLRLGLFHQFVQGRYRGFLLAARGGAVLAVAEQFGGAGHGPLSALQEHVLLAVDKLRKREVLSRMLSEVPGKRVLVFTRTKWGADKLARYLRDEGHPVAALHGGKTQSARNSALDKFRSGTIRILVATDLAARGVDVDDIMIVVNFDVPTLPEVYVHRVGRTARAGARGLALSLMSPDEWLHVGEIEKLLGRTLPREVVPGFEPSIVPMTPVERQQRNPVRRDVPTVTGRRGAARRRR
jgi:ATP-dependent RNA helicase RhlE